jgi:hypothetical protein
LLVAGSLLVHELRYVAGYGGGVSEALADQGHSYLPWLAALASILLAASVLWLLGALVRASRGIVAEPHPPAFVRVWAVSGTALAAVYTLQEGFEGTFAPGHPAGIAGILGHGGWTAFLFSLLVGALVAGLARLAHRAVAYVAARAARPVAVLGTQIFLWSAARDVARRPDVLALNLAGRAPPLP